MRAPDQLAGELNGQELSLYRMIWQRTFASQMADAVGTTVSVRLGAPASEPGKSGSTDCEFAASGTTITFPGYRQVYVESTDDDAAATDEREALLPELGAGDAGPGRLRSPRRVTPPRRRRVTPRPR